MPDSKKAVVEADPLEDELYRDYCMHQFDYLILVQEELRRDLAAVQVAGV